MSSFKFLSLPLASLLAPLLVACSSGSSPSDSASSIPCPSIALPAITVSVVDSLTRQPISGATVTALRADGYAETQTAGLAGTQSFAYQTLIPMDGVYDLKATKEGYQDWQAKDVAVTQGICGPQTVELEAAMVPLSR